MTLEEWKAKLDAEDEALRREAWKLNAPAREAAARFAALWNRECDDAIAADDAKARAMDEHGYGGPR